MKLPSFLKFGYSAEDDIDDLDLDAGQPAVAQDPDPILPALSESESLKPSDRIDEDDIKALEKHIAELSSEPPTPDEVVQDIAGGVHLLYQEYAAKAKGYLSGLRTDFTELRTRYERQIDTTRYTAIVDETHTKVKSILGLKADRLLRVQADSDKLQSTITELTVGITGTPDGVVTPQTWFQKWGLGLGAAALAVLFEMMLNYDTMQWASNPYVAGIVALSISGAQIYFTMNVAAWHHAREACYAARLRFIDYAENNGDPTDPKTGQVFKVFPIDRKTIRVGRISLNALIGMNVTVAIIRFCIFLAQDKQDFTSLLGTLMLIVIAYLLYTYKLKNGSPHPRAKELFDLTAKLTDVQTAKAALDGNTSQQDVDLKACVAEQQDLLKLAAASQRRPTSDEILDARDLFRARQVEFTGARPWFVELGTLLISSFPGLVQENSDVDPSAYRLEESDLQAAVEHQLPAEQPQADDDIIGYQPQMVHAEPPSISSEALVSELWEDSLRDAAERAAHKAAQSVAKERPAPRAERTSLASTMLRRS